MTRSRFAFVILATVLLPFFAQRGQACTCMPYRPPCQSYWESSVVFVGVVTDIKTTPPSGGSPLFDDKVVHFKVEEPFRGIESAEVDVYTAANEAACGYGFAVGQQYLVYAHREPATSKLSTNICTRTRRLATATEDLEYIRGLSRAEPGGRVFGKVRRYASELKDGQRAMIPIKKAKVIIEGEYGRFEVRTKKDGSYSFNGVRAGKYMVRLVVTRKYGEAHESLVEVYDRGCAEVNFMAQPTP